jgi:hypothetical protein
LCSAAELAICFENAMDLWMFADVSFLAGLWFSVHDVPDDYLIKSCDELGSAFESRVPVLFKHCFPAELTWKDFVFFPNSTQNMFPACDGELTRNYSFEGRDGSRSSVTSIVPCSESTLAQKMDRFWKPVAEEDKSYGDSHVYLMDAAELAHVSQRLEATGAVPKGFKFQGSVATMIHLLAQGFSTVRYFHSHLDRIFSFGMGKREWHVINPKHHSKFDRQWEINGAVMATRELAEAPRVKVVQERGDIFVLPPWWMHKTEPVDSRKEKGVNFNIHVFAEDQLVGAAMSLMRRFDLQSIFLS